MIFTFSGTIVIHFFVFVLMRLLLAIVFKIDALEHHILFKFQDLLEQFIVVVSLTVFQLLVYDLDLRLLILVLACCDQLLPLSHVLQLLG